MQTYSLCRAALVALALALGLPCRAQAQDASTSPVVSVRELQLKDGVSAQEFERYVATEYAPALESAIPGMEVSLLKGDRGKRKNAYLLVWEFDSVQRRNEYFPQEGGPASERLQQLMANMPRSRLSTFVQARDASDYTDYVMLR